MAENNQVVWGLHAGSTSQADAVFLQHNYVAIGWEKCDDLGAVPANREGFKKRVAECYPSVKPGAIPVYGGLLFRFCHEMKPGDLVAYPSKIDKLIHIGRITGEYRYDPSIDSHYPNLRSVEWLVEVPRTKFSQGALYEIGSALTLFQIKNYIDEFIAAAMGETITAAFGEDDDPTVGLVAEEIEQSTRDFILKQLSKELKGHPFADFVGHIMQCMGYRTRISPPGPDGGIDIVAHRDELGFEPPIIKVQVKSTSGTVGDPETSALFGKVASGEFGLMVTLGTFSKPAKQFAETKANLRLIDGDDFVGLVLDHYEDLDSRYKGLLPLKRVYVPQAIDDEA